MKCILFRIPEELVEELQVEIAWWNTSGQGFLTALVGEHLRRVSGSNASNASGDTRDLVRRRFKAIGSLPRHRNRTSTKERIIKSREKISSRVREAHSQSKAFEASPTRDFTFLDSTVAGLYDEVHPLIPDVGASWDQGAKKEP